MLMLLFDLGIGFYWYYMFPRTALLSAGLTLFSYMVLANYNK